jgi:PadR family transcriptional regulator, regulatory protein AphA
MARENKTRYALLGLLSISPMSGYDMKKFTDISLGYFWSENYGHIYPILRKLEEEGLIRKHTEHTRGKPDRNVFRLTAKGEKVLDTWLEHPADKYPIRDEFLLKLFFGLRIPREAVEKKLREERKQIEAYLAELEALETRVSADYGDKEDLPYWLMTLDFGKAFAIMIRDWCGECLGKLKSIKQEKNT